MELVLESLYLLMRLSGDKLTHGIQRYILVGG